MTLEVVVHVESLADRPDLLPQIAEAVFAEWQALCAANGLGLADVRATLAERSVRDRVPLALVLVDDAGRLLATGALKPAEPATRPGVGPWLDMMYVVEGARGGGVGRALLAALERRAAELGATTLHLSTDAAEGFYAKHGWATVEHQVAIDGKTVAFMTKSLAPVAPLDDAALLRFLRGHRYALEATVSGSRAPQAALVGIAVTDELEIVFDTLASTRKAMNLRADPRIALVVGGWGDDPRTAQLEGVADFPEGAELERLQRAYFGVFPDGPSRLAWPGLTYVRVTLRWARFSDFTVEPPAIVERSFAR